MLLNSPSTRGSWSAMDLHLFFSTVQLTSSSSLISVQLFHSADLTQSPAEYLYFIINAYNFSSDTCAYSSSLCFFGYRLKDGALLNTAPHGSRWYCCISLLCAQIWSRAWMSINDPSFRHASFWRLVKLWILHIQRARGQHSCCGPVTPWI